MSDIKLIQGDCLEVMRSLDAGSIDTVITDPPYGIGYHSNYYKDRNPHSPVANDWNFQIGIFLNECERVLKDGGALYLFCRWDVMPLWSPYIKAAQLKMKTAVAWIKDNWSAGDLEGSFGNQYEQILFIAKGRHLLRGKRWSNVWNFPRVPANQMLHPTQKPVALLERAVLASTDIGGLVLDPFCGSGSTGEACARTNRNAILGDIDPKMISITASRLGIPSPVAIERTDPSPTCELEIPDANEWGIHPEELAIIHHEIIRCRIASVTKGKASTTFLADEEEE